MVFFKKRMTRSIMVHPMYLGAQLKQRVKDQCTNEVMGESLGDIGFIIMVLHIQDENIGKGLIDHLTGRVRYEVAFDAIVFRPFRNEVMDACVSVCTSQGFFAEAGPFSLFVSRVHIPSSYEFRADDTSWANAETGAVLKERSNVRLKILGTNAVSRGISGIGTIAEPYLGVC